MAKDTFEAAVETAWAHFERTLTARLATMELDDIVFVMPTENTGLRFALRFGRRRHGSLHATIACETTGLDDLIRTSGWRKRTDGRLTCERHQGPAALAEIAAQTLAKDRRVVVYMGDDQANDYIYKFVSRDRMDRSRRTAARRRRCCGRLRYIWTRS